MHDKTSQSGNRNNRAEITKLIKVRHSTGEHIRINTGVETGLG